MTLETRLLKKIKKTDYCWLWTGALSSSGYGRLFLKRGQPRQAHRLVYELFGGNIGEGLQLDHLCRNPRCVNPYHLEVVDIKTNVLRGIGITANNARKIKCRHGHPFSAENTYIYPQNNGVRRKCKLCSRKPPTKHSLKEGV